ncbi:MAG: 3-mercaptopyruvate sulfurtransferase [Gemmatimonadales bacterium]|nr:3-mercaptopyruvate sulfurtransferase [Gemmatimonadales bacterium]
MIERALVTTQWLADRLGQPRLAVLDGSMYLPTSGRDATAEYAAAHIPGAVFFDLEASSDNRSSLPHMLPPAADFAERMSSLGLDDADDLVVYDGSGANLSAARVWWMFRTFGHERVAVLDGGIRKWRREGRPVEGGTVTRRRGSFSARRQPGSAIRNLEAVREAAVSGSEQIVDLRSAGRFTAAAPEPRAGLRGGHIPGSRSLPYDELVDADGTVLPEPALTRRITGAGVDLSRPIIATCGSGVSACALLLALHLLGHDQVSLYDGAWAEWGGRSDTPIDSGPGRSG